MNIKTLLLSPVLLAGVLAGSSPLQAGFEEEAKRIISGKYPYIAKIMRLEGEDPRQIHLVGKRFANKKTWRIEPTVRINGQAVEAQRVNQHLITLTLPADTTPEARITVSLAGKDSMAEVLGTPTVYASPDKALLAKPWGNFWEVKTTATVMGEDGTLQEVPSTLAFQNRAVNHFLIEGFSDKLSALAEAAPDGGQAITLELAKAMGLMEIIQSSAAEATSSSVSADAK